MQISWENHSRRQRGSNRRPSFPRDLHDHYGLVSFGHSVGPFQVASTRQVVMVQRLERFALEAEPMGSNPDHSEVVLSDGFLLLLLLFPSSFLSNFYLSLPTVCTLFRINCWHVLLGVVQLVTGEANIEITRKTQQCHLRGKHRCNFYVLLSFFVGQR